METCSACGMSWTSPPDICPHCYPPRREPVVASSPPRMCPVCSEVWTAPPDTCPHCLRRAKQASSLDRQIARRVAVANGIDGWAMATLVIGWIVGVLLIIVALATVDRDNPVNIELIALGIGLIFASTVQKALFHVAAEALRALGRMEDMQRTEKTAR